MAVNVVIANSVVVLGAIMFGIAVLCIVVNATKRRVYFSSNTWEAVDSYVSANFTVSRLVKDYDTRRSTLTDLLAEMVTYVKSLDEFDQTNPRNMLIAGGGQIGELHDILDPLPRIQSCFDYAVQCYNNDPEYTASLAEFVDEFIVIVNDNYIVK